MKAIMISIKPKWCSKIMNGEKTIEVRKNKALAKAIQKLIDEYGYADIYAYCTKGKPNLWLPYEYDCFELDEASQPYLSDKPIIDIDTKMNGKVIFKFRCYKVEEIDKIYNIYVIKDNEKSLIHYACWLYDTQLSINELDTYLNGNIGYAIHISDLEIFDKPKELSEFYPYCKDEKCEYRKNHCSICHRIPLTKAPQNYCYIETGK